MAYVALSTSTAAGGSVLVAFTTGQQWTGPRPPGLYSIDRETAAAMGQSRPFMLDLRRIASLPVTADWFPGLDTPDDGILGRAPEVLPVVYEAALTELTRRRRENIEHLGPLNPRPRR